MPRWERWGPLVFVCAYLAVILVLSRGIANEDWDGIKAINNGLLVARAGGPDIPLDVQRPPLGWLLMSPWLGWAYRHGGAAAALRAAHRLWPLYLGSLLLASFRFFREYHPAASAGVLGVMMAFNPILIQFAPFALMDIFAGLAVLTFLAAARRYLDQPDRGRLAWLALFYFLAFLSKYHLGLLILVPLAARLSDANARGLRWSARLRRFAISPLWLLPPACYLAGALVLAGLVAWTHGGNYPALPEAWRELGTNLSFNLMAHKQSHWHLYFFALWDQLGPALFLLMALGFWTWVREDGDAGRFLALALAIPYAALAFAIANKEARYAIPLLPLVYAAIGRGIQAAFARFPAPRALRVAAFGGCLALLPWSACLASARYLAEEPSVHTDVPWNLAEKLADAAPAEACIGWASGNLDFPIKERLFRYEHTLIVGAPTFKFFARNPVSEIRDGGGDPPDCRWLVIPREGLSGPRWEGAAAGRVFDASRTLRWEVYPDEVRPAR